MAKERKRREVMKLRRPKEGQEDSRQQEKFKKAHVQERAPTRTGKEKRRKFTGERCEPNRQENEKAGKNAAACKNGENQKPWGNGPKKKGRIAREMSCHVPQCEEKGRWYDKQKGRERQEPSKSAQKKRILKAGNREGGRTSPITDQAYPDLGEEKLQKWGNQKTVYKKNNQTGWT